MQKWSRFLRFVQWLVPVALTAIALWFVWPAWQQLQAASRSLECFCPSCPQLGLEEAGDQQLGLLRIDIQGAIKKPGVYQLALGQRVADALEKAGGLRTDADTLYIAKSLNLATPLRDSDKLYIPFLSERAPTAGPTSTGSGNDGGGAAAPGAAAPSTNSISINSASKEQLQSLSGIGEVRAQKIIDNRPYAQLSELVEKGALGQALFDTLQGQLTL
jgi:competence protein ComEA